MRTFKILGLLLLATTLLMSFSKKNQADTKVLPKEIQVFINKHFPNQKVVKTKVVAYEAISKYKVKLEGKVELEFNGKKEIIEIESKTKLPDSLINPKIRNYVSSNYPNNFIVEWEHEGDHQEIELNDGIELEFTWDGEFIKID